MNDATDFLALENGNFCADILFVHIIYFPTPPPKSQTKKAPAFAGGNLFLQKFLQLDDVVRPVELERVKALAAGSFQ